MCPLWGEVCVRVLYVYVCVCVQLCAVVWWGVGSSVELLPLLAALFALEMFGKQKKKKKKVRNQSAHKELCVGMQNTRETHTHTETNTHTRSLPNTHTLKHIPSLTHLA